MAGFFLFIFIIISFCFLGSILTEKKFEEFLPLSIFGIVIVAYLFGLCKVLKFNIYFLGIAALLSLGYGIYILIKRKDYQSSLKNVVTPGLVCFILLISLLMIYNNGRYLFQAWDEFSHWGAVVKNMFIINDFSVSSEAALQFRSYPPGLSLFLYDIQRCIGTFTESYLYVGSKLYSLAIFIYFYKRFKFKDVVKIILFSIILCALPLLSFENFYYTALIDPALSCITAFLALYIIFNEKRDYLFWATVIFGSCNLILLKDSGMFLFVLIVALLMVDYVKNFIKSKHNCDYKALLHKALPYIIAIVIPLIIALSWKMLIKINNAPVSFSTPYDFGAFIDTITGRVVDYRIDVVKAFINALISREMFTCLSFSFTSMHIILFLIIWSFYQAYKKENIQLPITLTITYLIYLFGLLLSYMFKFSVYEANKLASFERYNQTFLLIIFIIFFLYILIKLKKEVYYKYVPTVVALLLLSVSLSYTAYEYLNKHNTFQERLPYMEAKNNLASKIDEKNKILVIVQNSNGFDWQILNYEFMEFESQLSTGWSYGTPYGAEDVWTKNLSQNDFEKLMQTEEICYLYKIDDNFKSHYGMFFNVDNLENGQIFEYNRELNKYVLIN